MIWTKTEIRQLTRAYANRSNNELAARFNRTERAIACKASSLGLTKSSRYMNSLRKRT